MRIVYNIAGMYRPSGMERVLADKANWLAAHGHEVTILTTDQNGRPAAFPLDGSIKLIDLGIGYEDNNGRSIWNKIYHYPGKQLRHRNALNKVLNEIHPDITISMFCNEVNLLPEIKDGSHKLLEVHFSRFKRLQYGRTGLWALADRYRSRQDEKLVGKYERFVVLTEEDRYNWPHIEAVRNIYNPVHFRTDRLSGLDSKTVIAVGRYAHQKGFERLVDAWKTVCERLGNGHGWTLRLVGDGEMRDQLQRQIQDLGLSDSVILGKSESDMESVYLNASILAMPSRYEGLSMALAESQTFGIPAVSFDCPCGPKDIIIDGENGILVPEGDVEALAEGLVKLMKDDSLRKKMGESARQYSRRFDLEPIMKQWTDLFEEVISERS